MTLLMPNERATKVANQLIEWLEATTSYPDLKENLDRTWPNYDEGAKWSRFYQYGPVLMPDESGLLDADGKPTQMKIAIKAVCGDQECKPGEIITSRSKANTHATVNRYIVQPNGSIRKI